MAFKIVFTNQALTNLGEILDYIGADNPAAAARFGKELLNHSEILTTLPHLGVTINARENVHSLLHTPVRIYYQVDEQRKAVEIIHFWHTSRRPLKL